MKILGFEIGRPKAKAAGDVPIKPQYLPNAPQGPLTPWFRDYHLRKVSGDFYEALRECIPVIDAAIRRLISLNGTIKIIGTNGSLVSELEEFCATVPVNDHQHGIHAFLENFSNEVFEQGFSMPEYIATPDLKDIAQLRVPDSKQIFFRRNEDGFSEAWYRYLNNFTPAAVQRYSSPGTLVQRILNATYNQAVYINSGWEVKIDPVNKLYFSINNENTDPYGVAIMRSMEFCAQILMTMQNSLSNVWDRFGDPSYHVKYKTNKRDLAGVDLESRRQKIQNDFGQAIRAKRNGQSADFVTAVSNEADMEISIIGHDGQVLELEVPARHVLEQITSKTGLPAWMLGISSKTVQGMATLEVESCLQDAKIRQLSMLPEIIRLFSTVLRLRGRSWNSINLSGDPTKPGDWGVIFETPNLRDLVAQAQARFLNAQADQMGSAPKPGEQITVNTPEKKSACTCGHNHFVVGNKMVSGCKETRPIPWPQLDKVEEEYETRLKADWAEFAVKVFTIAKLDTSSIALGMSKEPGSEAFTFSEEQRAQILKEMETYIGSYSIDAPDSPLRTYYGESYSLGLIQAANMIGKERPILDIIKNKEIYDELCANGFQLVKDNITTAIKDRILAEMQAHSIAGSNPLSVANRLNKLFGDQNSSWERLARTEMADAAETAKTDEWKTCGVKKVDFVPAPDACPICQALSGTYALDDCPKITVHPRCRCAKRPAVGEV